MLFADDVSRLKFGRLSTGRCGRRGQFHVSISVQPGQMFEPVVERIAGNVAVDVQAQAVNQMNEQLPSRIDEVLQDPRMQ